MSGVSIDMDTFLQANENMLTQIDIQHGEIDAINSTVQFLSEVWEDEAQKIFAGHFEKFRQDVVKFNEALSSYLLMMRKSVDDFARVDSALYDVLK